MSAPVWSWADVPGLSGPPVSRPVPRPAGVKRTYQRWLLSWLAEGEHCAAPPGATLKHTHSVVSTAALRRGVRFVVHVTAPGDAGLFVRRVPLGTAGPGVQTVRAPVPPSSRLVTAEDAAS